MQQAFKLSNKQRKFHGKQTSPTPAGGAQARHHRQMAGSQAAPRRQDIVAIRHDIVGRTRNTLNDILHSGNEYKYR